MHDKDKLIEYLRKNVSVEVTAEEEDMPIRGNACAIDEETDKAMEDRIIADYNSGNIWAWCCVKVTVSTAYFKGVSYLGGCSYESGKDFVENSGYYQDMVDEALSDMADDIIKHHHFTSEMARLVV